MDKLYRPIYYHKNARVEATILFTFAFKPFVSVPSPSFPRVFHTSVPYRTNSFAIARRIFVSLSNVWSLISEGLTLLNPGSNNLTLQPSAKKATSRS